MMRSSTVASVVSLRELAAQRDVMEVLRRRAAWLGDEERALLTLYLDSGSSVRQIARWAGLRRSTVGRRIRKVIARLCDETYPVCLRQRGRFSERELILIKDYFVRGLSTRGIARNRKVSFYRVRLTVRQARRLVAERESAADGTRGDAPAGGMHYGHV